VLLRCHLWDNDGAMHSMVLVKSPHLALLRDMPTGRDYVRFRVKTGSHEQTGKMTRLTRIGYWA